MPDTYTTNLNLTKPEVGSSTDTWGTKGNTNLDSIDSLFDAGPVLKLAKGGTGAATAANARTNLGLGSIAVQDADYAPSTHGFIPIGVIVLWSGSTASIPSGWNICDGTNGTPDLRSKFVVGAGTDYAVGDTGGSNTATTSTDGAHTHTTSSAGAHSHTGSTASHALTIDEMPAHGHRIYTSPLGGNTANEAGGRPTGDSDGNPGPIGTLNTATDTLELTGGGNAHSHTISSDGAHTHDVNSNGDHSHTVDTRSPYYALAYIMRVA